MEEVDPWTGDADVVRHFLARHLQGNTPGKFYVVTVPAPYAPLETFYQTLTLHQRVFWAPPKGAQYAACGHSWKMQLSGKDSLPLLRDQLAHLFENLIHHAGDPAAPAPRVFGGVAFATDGEQPVDEWRDFGDGCFTLPRWTYTRQDDVAFVSLSYRGEENFGIDWQHTIVEQFESLFEALEGHEGASTGIFFHHDLPPVPPASFSQVDPRDWSQRLDGLLAELRAGRVRKVVAARKCVIPLPEPVRDVVVLARLSAEFPETTRFAFERNGTTFLGATPETLFRKSGLELTTEALAGSIRSLGSEFPSASRQSQVLMRSSKDQLEHDLVVSHITRALEPFAAAVKKPEAPMVRKFRNIIHLQTSISADLLPNVNAVDILGALHPTPAVAGVPTAEAMRLIRNTEGTTRGWYAGAIGWFDSRGDAQFNVAIRCGLLRGDRECIIYTGAGIVEGSEADAEYAETELKQQPMLRAIGASR